MIKFISILLSFLVTITPPSDFTCEGEPLNATIYNNLNGDYQVTNDLENIDVGAFTLLKWKNLEIMIPRTFNAGEISFSDRRWWWSYRDKDNEHGIMWNDKSLKIKWPIKKPIISKKDKLNPKFEDFV